MCWTPLDNGSDRVRGIIRKSGADYLAYAILDAVIDGYFQPLESLGDYIETLEQRIHADPSARNLQAANDVKASVLILRRLIWPQRQALNTLVRDGHALIQDPNRIYFRDTFDNCMQAAEITETYREFVAGLVNTHLSVASNRMNETMKVLTVMASIFIPLSFLAGIFGMNFEHMPELHIPWAYPVLLLIMICTSFGMILYFRKRGWIGSSKSGNEW